MVTGMGTITDSCCFPKPAHYNFSFKHLGFSATDVGIMETCVRPAPHLIVVFGDKLGFTILHTFLYPSVSNPVPPLISLSPFERLILTAHLLSTT